MSVCVCVCERKRRERERGESVCVCERERERDCLCVCEWVCECVSECVSVWVSVCVRERDCVRVCRERLCACVWEETVCVCACVRACVCEREREREKLLTKLLLTWLECTYFSLRPDGWSASSAKPRRSTPDSLGRFVTKTPRLISSLLVRQHIIQKWETV